MRVVPLELHPPPDTRRLKCHLRAARSRPLQAGCPETEDRLNPWDDLTTTVWSNRLLAGLLDMPAAS